MCLTRGACERSHTLSEQWHAVPVGYLPTLQGNSRAPAADDQGQDACERSHTLSDRVG